jgi:Tfp pilus assembly protein PilF
LDLNAWDRVQRGFAHLYDFTKEGVIAARADFEAAIRIDPNYADAYVGLASAHNRDFILGYSDSFEASLKAFGEAARRAVAADSSNSSAHHILSIVYLWEREFDRSVSESERAVELNPSNAWACAGLGHHLTAAGRPEDGIPWLERGLRLNPRDSRQAVWIGNIARSHLLARRYREAADWARKAIERQPAYPDGSLVLASSLGHLGDTKGAAQALAQCEESRPGHTSNPKRWYPYKNQEDWDHFLAGLRKAGWEG